MTLGNRIYQLRTARNLSQGDLAEALDVSRQSVSKWETDASVPELDKLVKLCELFEVSMDELVRGEEKSDAAAGADTVKKPWLPRVLEIKRVKIALILLALSFVVRIFGPVGIMIGTYGLIPCAILCLVVKKNTAMWCGWILYLVYMVTVRVFKGEWYFIWHLAGGSMTDSILALLSFIGLVGMVMWTAHCIMLYYERKEETR